LSSGEKSLAAMLAENHKSVLAGQEVRLLNIPADRGKGLGAFDHLGGFPSPDKLAQAMHAAATANYGTAGPAFIRKLLKYDREAIVRAWRAFEADFLKEAKVKGACGQVHRAVTRFALVGFAGELATTFGIVPWTTNDRLMGEARSAALDLFQTWRTARGGNGSHEERRQIEQIRHLLARYGDARFERTDSPTGQAIHDRWGWRKGSGTDCEWYILPPMWRAELCKGLDANKVARMLKERGILRPDKDGKHLARKETLHKLDDKPPGKSDRFYTITSKIFEDED
jgi:uncharacterized protein (DUF927 family)